MNTSHLQELEMLKQEKAALLKDNDSLNRENASLYLDNLSLSQENDAINRKMASLLQENARLQNRELSEFFIDANGELVMANGLPYLTPMQMAMAKWGDLL